MAVKDATGGSLTIAIVACAIPTAPSASVAQTVTCFVPKVRNVTVVWSLVLGAPSHVAAPV